MKQSPKQWRANVNLGPEAVYETPVIEGFIPCRARVHDWLAIHGLYAMRDFEMDDSVDYLIMRRGDDELVGRATVLRVRGAR